MAHSVLFRAIAVLSLAAPGPGQEPASAVVETPAPAAAPAPGPPPVSDLEMFPPLAVCEEQVRFLQTRLDWVNGQYGAVPDSGWDGAWAAYWAAARADALARLWAWQKLAAAHQYRERKIEYAEDGWPDEPPTWDDLARRELATLRGMIGPAAYFAREMPGAVGPFGWPAP